MFSDYCLIYQNDIIYSTLQMRQKHTQECDRDNYKKHQAAK